MFAAIAIVAALLAGSGVGTGLDETVNAIIGPGADFIADEIVFYRISVAGIEIPLLVIWLTAGSLFFTFYMRFINFRGFAQAFRVVSGRYAKPGDPGEISHFQALSAAVSGTVGLGNIAGVAVAITLGGPGATFWMILAGLFGMTSKFVECTLGLKYREIDENGVVTGGPMEYLSRGLANRGWPRLGRGLAIYAALACIGGAFGSAALFQVNQAGQQFALVMVPLTGGEDSIFNSGWVFGVAARRRRPCRG